MKDLHFTAIAAVAKLSNGEYLLGDGDTIPWYNKEDLQHYKQYTMGKSIVVGTKTAQTLPSVAFKGRQYYVLTRNKNAVEELTDSIAGDVTFIHSIYDAPDNAVIAGGAQLYMHALPFIDEFVVTEFESPTDGIQLDEQSLTDPVYLDMDYIRSVYAGNQPPINTLSLPGTDNVFIQTYAKDYGQVINTHDDTYRMFVNAILEDGRLQTEGIRNNHTRLRRFGGEMRFNLSDGTFPLITLKKTFINSIEGELTAFINGETNVKDFHNRGCTLWDEWVKYDPSHFLLPNGVRPEVRVQNRDKDWFDRLEDDVNTFGCEVDNNTIKAKYIGSGEWRQSIISRAIWDGIYVAKAYWLSIKYTTLDTKHAIAYVKNLRLNDQTDEICMAIKRGDLVVWPHWDIDTDVMAVIPASELALYKEREWDTLFTSSNVQRYALGNGDLGPVYSKQWRNFEGVDQLKNAVETLVNQPYSSRNLVSAWNPIDLPQMALPPCHCLYQLLVDDATQTEKRKFAKSQGLLADAFDDVEMRRLSLRLDQRSADAWSGVPANIASYAMLLLKLASTYGLIPGELIWQGGDCHLYGNQIGPARTMVDRTSLSLPRYKLHLGTYFDLIGDNNLMSPQKKSYVDDPDSPAFLDMPIVISGYETYPHYYVKIAV